jgi:hypothetical protein
MRLTKTLPRRIAAAFGPPRCRLAPIAGAAAAILLALNAAWPAEAPANTLKELFAEMNQCLAKVRGAAGSEFTIVFSLRRDGALLGQPKITYSKRGGDAADQRQFADNIAAAMNACMPLRITDGLGGAIAGRLFTWRFIVRPPETGI